MMILDLKISRFIYQLGAHWDWFFKFSWVQGSYSLNLFFISFRVFLTRKCFWWFLKLPFQLLGDTPPRLVIHFTRRTLPARVVLWSNCCILILWGWSVRSWAKSRRECDGAKRKREWETAGRAWLWLSRILDGT